MAAQTPALAWVASQCPCLCPGLLSPGLSSYGTPGAGRGAPASLRHLAGQQGQGDLTHLPCTSGLTFLCCSSVGARPGGALWACCLAALLLPRAAGRKLVRGKSVMGSKVDLAAGGWAELGVPFACVQQLWHPAARGEHRSLARLGSAVDIARRAGNSCLRMGRSWKTQTGEGGWWRTAQRGRELPRAAWLCRDLVLGSGSGEREDFSPVLEVLL